MKIQIRRENLENYKIGLFIVKTVENFLEKKGYLKIDLPVLSPALIPESYLEVFETEFRYFDKKERLYLIPSPELFLKRLLAYGIGDCYYLGKSFRNSEPNSPLHSYEFTMLEIYKIRVNYFQLADDVLQMLQYIDEKIKAQSLKRKSKFNNIHFNRWEKISVTQAFEKYAGISEKELFNHQLFLKKAQEKGYWVKGFTYVDVWSQIYTQEIEPHLGRNGYPTLIYDYPKEFAALAQLNLDGKTAQRFEFYIHGIELGDCYTELTDYQEQERRFKEEQEKRKKLKKVNHPIDKDFIEALKYGLPPCAGIAIGLDRLAMIFSGVFSINELKLIEIKL